MDTISQIDSEKKPAQPKENHDDAVKERLTPAAPGKQSGFPFGKIIASAAILMMLVVIQVGPMRSQVFQNKLFQTADSVADEYIDKSFKRAMIAYATARGINAVISVIQESELQIEPGGIGVTIAVGEVLDPVNDMVERFSWIMLASLLSLGIQKSLVVIAPWLSISVLLNISLVCMLPAIWMKNAFSDRLREIAKKTLFAAIILKFAMPCVAYLNHQVYVTILEDQYESASAMMEKNSESLKSMDLETTTENDPVDSEATGLWDKTKQVMGQAKDALKKVASVKGKIAALKEKAGEMTENFIRLSIVFILNTIVIPILFLWGLINIGRLLIGNTFGGQLEQAFKSRIFKDNPPEGPGLEAAATK